MQVLQAPAWLVQEAELLEPDSQKKVENRRDTPAALSAETCRGNPNMSGSGQVTDVPPGSELILRCTIFLILRRIT